MKCALVTGGSRGIGRAVCIDLAREGYYILINFKSNANAAEETLKLIAEAGGAGVLLPFDVADAVQVKDALTNWIATNADKQIAILVNNAGIREDSLLAWMEQEQWHRVINTNLDSFFYTTQIILGHMLTNRYGRIVNVVSLSGLKGHAGQANYSAAKAGVIGATKSLAQEVGRQGITVNAVAPGFIKTDMTADLDEKELQKHIPVKRFGSAEEVAHAVSFLASEKAAYITGQVLSVNGGLYT